MKVSKRLMSVFGLLVGWALLFTIHLNGEHTAFVSFVAMPALMLVMAFMAALHEA